MCGSSSQYCNRSLPETSALLPTLTKDERPRPSSLAYSMIARPNAPLCEDMATRPGSGATGPKVALSRTSGSRLRMPEAVGADHPHPVAPHLAHELLLELASPSGPVSANPAVEDDERAHALFGTVVDDPEHGGLRDGDDRPDRRAGDIFDGWVGRDRRDHVGLGVDGVDRARESPS